MFFGPIHFLLTREITRALGVRVPSGYGLLDLGCGTGVAGAVWAMESNLSSNVELVDHNAWALAEAKWTLEHFGIRAATKSADIRTLPAPNGQAVVAAFTMNELDDASRSRFRRDFLSIARSGGAVLVIEPISRAATPWWEEWAREWKIAGGRSDQWRFRVDLPERLALMDRAAGLDHRELTGRSLWLPPLA